MQVYIQVKQLGKRKPNINAHPLIIDDALSTVYDLLYAIVANQVSLFNNRLESNIDDDRPNLLNYLSLEHIENQSASGKISFNLDYRQQKQEVKSAFDNVLTAFNDGLFCIFLNDNELSSLETPIDLQENDKLTFVRLTMLSGRIW